MDRLMAARLRVLALFGACWLLPARSLANDDVTALALPEVLAYAEAHSPYLAEVRAAKAKGAASAAEAGKVLRDNPTVEVAVGPRYAGGEHDYDFVVALSQPVEIGGQGAMRRDAAQWASRRGDAEARGAAWNLRRAVRAAYRDAVITTAKLALAQDAETVAADVERSAERRAKAGDISGLEVDLARAEAMTARDACAQWSEARLVALTRLRVVTGFRGPTTLVPRDGLGGLRDAPSRAALMDVAMAEDPAVASARAEVREAEARARLAGREGWPTPSLGVQFAREGSVGSPANNIVLGMVSLPLPLWDRNQGERIRAEADADLARAHSEIAVRETAARVQVAWSALVSATDRVRAAEAGSANVAASMAGLARAVSSGELRLTEAAVLRERLVAAAMRRIEAYEHYFHALSEVEELMTAEQRSNTETER